MKLQTEADKAEPSKSSKYDASIPWTQIGDENSMEQQYDNISLGVSNNCAQEVILYGSMLRTDVETYRMAFPMFFI